MSSKKPGRRIRHRPTTQRREPPRLGSAYSRRRNGTRGPGAATRQRFFENLGWILLLLILLFLYFYNTKSSWLPRETYETPEFPQQEAR